MVQMFYYDCRGQNCHKVLRHEGFPSKVLLFPSEGWAQPAGSSHLSIKMPWWSRSRCEIVESCTAGKKCRTRSAKVVECRGGTMVVVGRFKGTPHNPDFKLVLTTNVSNADFQLGYSITGTLERGNRKEGKMQMTHFAMIKRKGY